MKEEKTEEHHQHHKHHKHHKTSLGWRIVGGVLVVAQLAVTVMVVISLFKTSILDPLWMVIVLFVLVSLFIMNFTLLVLIKRPAKAMRFICIILSILCIAGCVWALRYTSALNNFLDRVSHPSQQIDGGSDKEVLKEPFLVYISGSDSRDGLQEKTRSDVNILAAVNPEKGKILLVSIPRDTYVQLHETTGLKDKLTHAGVYGVDMSKNTIEDFLGVKIDHVIKVSFDTVVRVVDQLDGIDIVSDQAMNLKAENGENCNFVEGKQHVDGDCALRFSRERKSYETGDRHRGENQQQVITSIIERLSGSRNYVMKLPEILDVAADSFETTFQRDDISSYIRAQLSNEIDWKVESISVDGTGAMEPTYSMGANRPLYVMIPSQESVDKATKTIKEYLKDE